MSGKYDNDAILALWQAGKTEATIGRTLGYDSHTVGRIVCAARKRGDPHAVPHVKLVKDPDGRHRVGGWINLAAPEKQRRLDDAGKLWGTMPAKQVARLSGVPYDALRRAFDEPYKRRICARINANRQRKAFGDRATLKRDGTPMHFTELRPRDTDVAARLAEIPDDDRSITARLCGDPLKGRSALDRRRAA
jgi:hypothetical protein